MLNLKKMKMTLSYYKNRAKTKLLTKALITFCKFKTINDVAYFSCPNAFRFSGKIIFDFTNQLIMHPGDQLFYQPAIEILNKSFNVSVLTTTKMKDYFATLGYNTTTLDKINKNTLTGAIIISNKDFLWEMKHKYLTSNLLLGIDYPSLKQVKRVVNIIFDTIEKLLLYINITIPKQDIKFCPKVSEKLLEKHQNSELLNILHKNPTQEFFIFSNYGVSRPSGMGATRKKLLAQIAQEKKKQGYLIIHVGTKKDKETDPETYDFVDYDFRGKSNTLELFAIFAQKQIKGGILFDSYPMHVGSILRKDLHVVIKSRANKEEDEKVKKIFVPMASRLEETIKTIK